MKQDAAWAEDEFGAVDLGDVRRNARLVPYARGEGKYRIPMPCSGSPSPGGGRGWGMRGKK
jgi:hypothetical protein